MHVALFEKKMEMVHAEAKGACKPRFEQLHIERAEVCNGRLGYPKSRKTERVVLSEGGRLDAP